MATQKDRKKERREEAATRLKLYNNLTSDEKLELIRSRRGKSKKEERRILTITKENNNEKNN